MDVNFLTPLEMQRALSREKARVERSGRHFALAVFSASPEVKPEQTRAAARTLMMRARGSDYVGELDGGNLAALLPETLPHSAWIFARSVLDRLRQEGLHFGCEVYGYPPLPERRDTTEDQEPPQFPTNGARNGAPEATTRAPAREEATSGTVHDLSSAFYQPMPRWKRAMDVVGSSILLVLALPLGLGIALAIKLTSRGSVIFSQERGGLGGKPFTFYKFRTMVVDAEQRKESLRSRDERRGPTFKIVDDPRVTAVGKLLRATSLDELPQLWNVLRGDMSLVGPRPPTMDEIPHYDVWQLGRLHVTGGLTCEWQVNGRSNVPFVDWVRMDLRYAKNRSLMKDLVLLARTPLAVVRGNGAH